MSSSATVVARVALVCVWALVIAACRATPLPSPFRVSTDAQARALVQDVLQRAASGDDGSAWTCDHRPLWNADAPPMSLSSHVTGVEAAWSAKEPLFLVELAGHTAGTRTLRLHARAGCLEAASPPARDIAL